MPRKRLIVTAVAFLTVMVCANSIRHDSRRPMQRFGEFEAQREINRWHLFGREIYVQNHMGVFPASTRMPLERGQAPLHECRVFGYAIGKQDDHFGLGDDDHDQVSLFRYIFRTKMQSADPEDRVWFISKLWSERYPGYRKDVESLLEDPDKRVRQAAKERLDFIDHVNAGDDDPI